MRARVSIPPALLAALGLLMAGSLLLRMSGLESGYWIDEGIAVGIASHDFSDIPSTLSMDGSPPLYYLLLHGWMALVGEGEAATRALSLIFAVLAVPVAYWAGNAIFDRRTGVLAAIGVAACPFLNYYAQETRMYSLVVVLSLLASASFVLGVPARAPRAPDRPRGVDDAAVLHPRLGPVPRRRDGLRVDRPVAARAGARPRRAAGRRRRAAALRAVDPDADLAGAEHRRAVVRAADAADAAGDPVQPLRRRRLSRRRC